MSGELQHRSVRFWTVRTRRWSYFIGKILGLWALVALITLVLNIIAGTVVARARLRHRRASSSPGACASGWSPSIIAGSWAAIATFISSLLPDADPRRCSRRSWRSSSCGWCSLVGFIVRASDMVESGAPEGHGLVRVPLPEHLRHDAPVARADQGVDGPRHPHRLRASLANAAGVDALPAKGHLSRCRRGSRRRPEGRRRPVGDAAVAVRDGGPGCRGRREEEEKEEGRRGRGPPPQADQALRRQDGGRRACRSVPAGAVYGLIGPNGAGKTTTFSMMAGYLHPSEGIGRGPRLRADRRWTSSASRVGVLPQDALLPPNDKVGEFLVHMARTAGHPRRQGRGAARASRSPKSRARTGGTSAAAACRTAWPSASRSRRRSSASRTSCSSTSRRPASIRASPTRCASSSRPRRAAARSSSRATTCRSSRRSATPPPSSIAGASSPRGRWPSSPRRTKRCA